MGYRHIDNLYKNQTIFNFKRCIALEKIHGTSAHVAWKDGSLRFFSGGANHETFSSIFDEKALIKAFKELGHDEVVVYGEAYGGKMQRMRKTYGESLRFIAFDVKVGDTWLNVFNANDIATKLNLDFVHWKEISTDLNEIDAERDAPSVQAIRNLAEAGAEKMREGVVLRPLNEFRDSSGNRVMCKHKCDKFMETKTPRKVDPDKLKVIEEANAIAFEWVTDERLRHVLDKFPEDVNMESTGQIIKAMVEDVTREAEGEIIDSKEARKAIGREAVKLFKKHIKTKLEERR